uniref:Tryptophan synthase beta chain-like PALP domain-containing protein n=1 Tax=Branchiostoma floridae TaxID=7739 RepID=C3ZIX7_BRAFL|eukprot:XP_002591482.1 hypothetical protein BRAFLDRAFT_105254 [Branchiostoma floridae]
MSSSASPHSEALVPYTPRPWAARLRGVPKYRLQLGQLNTPIQRWRLNDLPDGVEVFIKRDDMTGSTLSGNKNPSEVGCEGNLLQDRLMGANVYLVQRTEWYEEKLLPRMKRLASRIKETSGKESYLIPVGGSNLAGLFGYITAFQELMEQGVLERFDDLVVTVGSGGTTCGLCVANYLTGSKIRIHAVAICDDAAYFHRHINNTLQEIGLMDVRSEDIVDIIEGYKGRGYALSTKKELEFVANIAHTSGIILDPVYTGKAAIGLLQELRTNQSRFQGNRILFLHTGGIFGLYDGRMSAVLKDGMRHVTDRVHDWWNPDDDPPFP